MPAYFVGSAESLRIPLGSAFSLPAVKAFIAVNGYYAAAHPAGPTFLLFLNEFSYARIPDIGKVVEHAHAVPAPVALVQPFQPGAGIGVALETIGTFCYFQFLAVPDNALFAVPGHIGAVRPAARAQFFIPQISTAEGAIHPTGCDHYTFDQTRALPLGTDNFRFLFHTAFQTGNLIPSSNDIQFENQS